MFVIVNSCKNGYIYFDPLSEGETIVVPDIIIPEESENDPEQTGVACNSLSKSTFSGELIDIIEIPDDLPEKYDLSFDMPPVRSQGNQGSCVAWATTYYLKSYQEKIQYGYDYASYEDVMSPAFVYNQIKQNENCDSGSTIVDALEILKTYGSNSWKDFPYSDLYCSSLPSDDLKESAIRNKIAEYFVVGIPENNTDINYTLTNLIKTLVFQKNPIVISMDFKNLSFENQGDVYIANRYKENPVDSGCGHAILIVGYDNQLNAFKIINSWGTDWGNDGYCWVSYDFFLPTNNIDFQEGFSGAYIAYDEE